MANLNTLHEMILDEGKLVTYVSLSKELCIHVNESKMLLQQFVKNIRQKKLDADLSVNYIVSGITNKNSARTTVCTEAELESFKKDYNSIFYEHIYSLSKGDPRVDNAALLATNKTEDLILCMGLIKNNNCVKRTADEIGTLKSNSQDIFLQDEKILNTAQKKVKKENEEVKSLKGSENKKVETKATEVKLFNNIKSEKCSPKKNTTNHEKGNKVNVKQKGITGFFSKLNGNSSKSMTEESKKEKTTEDQSKIEIKQEQMTEDNDMTNKATPDSKDNQIQKDIKANKSSNKNNDKKDDIKEKKSPLATKNKMKVDKKRKRIVVQSDSESENECKDNDPFLNEEQTELQNESEDEIPPTPCNNTVKITSGIVNPKKRRKIVDKTYTSEDGYFLTKKVEVYESCSENEEEISKENVVRKVKVETSPKEKKNEVKKKKISPPKTGKQPTMMNFFKKSVN